MPGLKITKLNKQKPLHADHEAVYLHIRAAIHDGTELHHFKPFLFSFPFLPTAMHM